jgi:hypothetical protein
MSCERSRLVALSVLVASFIGVCPSPGAQARGQNGGDQGQDELALRERFFHDAPLQWKEYAEKAKQLQGKFSFEAAYPTVNVEARNVYDLKRSGRNKLIIVSMERTVKGKKQDEDFRLFGINPDYAFELRRVTSVSPWVLAKLMDLRKGQVAAPFQGIFEEYEGGTADLVRLFNEPLEEIVRKPEFRVLHCRAGAGTGDGLVEVEFDYSHETQERGGNPVQGGTLLLDQQRFWSLRSYHVRTKSKGFQGMMEFNVLEVGDSGATFPVPKRAVRKSESRTDDGKTHENEFRYEYDLRVPRKLPGDEEFRLSAFGLPEPMGMPVPRRSHWYIWLGLAGLGAILLALVCKKRARLLRERAAARRLAKR